MRATASLLVLEYSFAVAIALSVLAFPGHSGEQAGIYGPVWGPTCNLHYYFWERGNEF